MHRPDMPPRAACNGGDRRVADRRRRTSRRGSCETRQTLIVLSWPPPQLPTSTGKLKGVFRGLLSLWRRARGPAASPALPHLKTSAGRPRGVRSLSGLAQVVAAEPVRVGRLRAARWGACREPSTWRPLPATTLALYLYRVAYPVTTNRLASHVVPTGAAVSAAMRRILSTRRGAVPLRPDRRSKPLDVGFPSPGAAGTQFDWLLRVVPPASTPSMGMDTMACSRLELHAPDPVAPSDRCPRTRCSEEAAAGRSPGLPETLDEDALHDSLATVPAWPSPPLAARAGEAPRCPSGASSCRSGPNPARVAPKSSQVAPGEETSRQRAAGSEELAPASWRKTCVASPSTRQEKEDDTS